MEKKCDRLINPREAIEMIQHCRKDQLPYVLDILRVAGYEFTEKDAQFSRVQRMTAEQRNAAARSEKEKSWQESDDEAVLLLRSAYLKGIKFTDIYRLTGINRTVLYKYLNGDMSVPLAYRDMLIETLKNLIGGIEENGK